MYQQINIDFYLKYNENAKLEEYKNRKFVTYTRTKNNRELYYLIIWKGKQKEPYHNYYYTSIGNFLEAIVSLKKSADLDESYKKKRKLERQSFTPEFEVGDIFSSSWGYEQTNVDFYQVINKPSKHYAEIRKIAQKNVEDSVYSHGMACEVLPVKDLFLDDVVMRKKVGQYGIKLNSFANAYKWDGKPKYKSWYY